MRTVRITAKTIEAAVAEGLEKLGISREEAVVHVVEQPSSGLFGLIHKKMAVVDISAPDEEAEEDTVEEASPAEEAPAAEIPAEEAKEETPAEEPKAEEAALEAEEAPAEEKKAEREEPTFDPEEQKKVAEEAKTFLAGVFAGMHLAVTMECRMTEERIMINLVGDGLGILIGKHGQTLDALQYLTNLAAGKSFRHHYFILLDVDGADVGNGVGRQVGPLQDGIDPISDVFGRRTLAAADADVDDDRPGDDSRAEHGHVGFGRDHQAGVAMEGIDQARRQRPLQGEIAVHTGSALFQHGGGKGLGIVQGRQAQALAGRPFIDGEQGIDISRRRHDGLAFQFCSQTAGDGIGAADMTGQDGDDELALLVDKNGKPAGNGRGNATSVRERGK